MERDKFTISESFIDVGDGHQLYVHDWGNKKAKNPIIFLHGGPGGSVNDGYKEYFDSQSQRVIFFDQRGAGKSLPAGLLEHNTTDDLVSDIKKIADHLGIKNFIITGGSWGSCLALAFALKHPSYVSALVLRGIFTGSQAEIDYLDDGHWATHFPDVWDRFLDATPESYQDKPSAYHAKRILGNDEVYAKESAYAYSELEGSLIRLDDRHTPQKFEDYDLNGTRIEVHYLQNRCFLADRYIMDNAHRLTMPIWLIQGRYDFVCPPVTAYELAHKLPNAKLIWTIAGHSGSDRESWAQARTVLAHLTEEK